jgi:AmiR/NasT family two-component response regulator
VGEADKPADTRAPDTIENEIEATRQRLALTIDQLVYRASPKTIARREIAGVKAYFVDPAGSPRTGNIAKVAGAVVGAVALVVVLRKVTK